MTPHHLLHLHHHLLVCPLHLGPDHRLDQGQGEIKDIAETYADFLSYEDFLLRNETFIEV